MGSRLSITVERAAPATILRLRGEIDAGTYSQLQQEAQKAFEAGARDMLLDLTEVAYVSSAGVRAIHHIFTLLRTDAPEESEEAVSQGLRDGTFKSPHLKLLNPSASVSEILKTTGMDMYLEIHRDLQTALASFKPAGKERAKITVRQVQGRVPVTILQPHGDLDASNFKDLIAQARQIYNAGGRDLLLDLSDVPYMSSSGLVALHSIAKIMQAEQPPDLELGWEALHAVSEARQPGLQQHVKLLNPQPEVDSLFGTVGFKQFFEIYTDEAAALASF